MQTSILLGSYLNIFATEIIDIDKFSFSSTQIKGVRVVCFDTDNQRFTAVNYFVQTTPAPFKWNLLDFTFDSDCNVDLSSESKLENYTLTTKGTIKIKGKDLEEADVIDDEDASNLDRCVIKKVSDFQNNGEESKRLILTHKKIDIRTAQHIKNKLNEYSGKIKSKGALEATFYRGKEKENKAFSNLSADVSDNNKERGTLGELATTLTMIHFGYQGHFSKYGTDNGFDGIFTDNSDDPEMFITESKCRERADGVKTIMKDNLFEKKIADKLQRIFTYTHPTLSIQAKKRLVETATLVGNFINENPDKIFKFAHRIKPDGICECLVEKFDVSKYQASMLHTLSPQSPMKDKLLVLDNITTQLCLTEDEKAKLFISSLRGARAEKLELIFKALNIEDEKQEAMLAIITPKKEGRKVLNYAS
ncbi:hypothetical protein [Candidatus Odyssella thessalonicensis]|uniref:hypothetical protein n=1 Tax=Candidatus Odyssella thessalonicensis TaxID=84647 RepID=UPI0011129EAF|nr:hypothetical protein [Candidatus Odyssella thessalonicensis]